MNEPRLGGLCLTLGSTVTFAAIASLECIGRLAPTASHETLAESAGDFWHLMQHIWGWEAIGHAVIAAGSLLLAKATRGLVSVAWMAMTIYLVMTVIALTMTLGIELAPTPEAWTIPSFEGASRALQVGQWVGLGLMVALFSSAAFGRSGVVGRSAGMVALGSLAAAGLGAAVGVLPTRVVSMVLLVQPIVLGLGHWRMLDRDAI
ncbi:MAG: hypothetical protein ACE37K_13460 [Planctomycetota bacterium]